MKAFIKFLCDFVPLIAFFAAFKIQGIMFATATLIAVTIPAVAAMYIIYKEIPIMVLVSTIIIGIFGGITLLSNDDSFIKMKPTIVSSIFAAALLFDYIKNKMWMKSLFGSSLNLNNSAWKILALRWGIFFAFIAIANEFIWRNMPTETWVNFKVFGLLSLTILFTLAQIPFIYKESKKIASN